MARVSKRNIKVVEEKKINDVVEDVVLQDAVLQNNILERQEKFLDAYIARKSVATRFSEIGGSLRDAKSRENLIFWGTYAVSREAFGGAAYYGAPPFNKEVFLECARNVGYTYSRLPSAIRESLKKQGIRDLPILVKACLDQEEASRASSKRAEAPPELQFNDSTLEDVLAKVTDSLPLGKVMAALKVQLERKLLEQLE